MTQQRSTGLGISTMSGPFRTPYVPRAFGGTILPFDFGSVGIAPLAKHIPCRLYPVSIPIELQVQMSLPVDFFDLYTDWLTLDIKRADYFIDEVTGAQYSVYGKPEVYTSHIWCRVSQPTGSVP